ncbi:N-acetylmuramoyl-L-alanine amidase [Aliiroseovarius sp. PTFE2010]|uniref:N-acetylmuramoyl-L-alanine amidase n=1 Tax=Aliiroseovarius sp. PTFE2010 TaxID=3417190 RepID=UPI003CEAA004
MIPIVRVWLAVVVACFAVAASAQTDRLTGLARVDPAHTRIYEVSGDTVLELALSQPVPFRIFALDNPRRMVIDLSEVVWDGLDPDAMNRSFRVSGARVGGFQPGWSRMVLDLSVPLGLVIADVSANASGALITMTFEQIDDDTFAEGAGAPPDAQITPPAAETAAPRRRYQGDRPLVVVLDPGHGGIDPGAQADGMVESHLMLTFAQELRDMLIRSGGFHVVLTRTDDSFVPLEHRITIAREAGADVFLSLHADALAEGTASGASVYTLAEKATDRAAQQLAERHDRADLLAGVDLSDTEDEIAIVLMDLARTETAPRTERFAKILVEELTQNIKMHKKPRHRANFSVLKAPDIPSVLLEIGFLSSARDRQRLSDPAWRAKAVWAMRDALQRWAEADAAEAQLIRQ